MKLQKIHSDAMKIDLWDALIKKVKHEQNTYEAWLRTLNPDEVINHAGEYTVREEIIALVETTLYLIDEMKAMLKSPSLLEDIYNEYKHFGAAACTGLLKHFIEVIAYRIINGVNQQ